jgi:glycosyltransferase involved in cell wall biosynthesis
MRIGYLTYGLDRAPTGIGRYAVDLLQAMATLPGAPEIVLLTTEREDPLGLWRQFEHYSLPGCRLLPALMTIGNLALALAAWRYKLDLIHDPNGIAPFFALGPHTRRVVTICDAFAYIYPEAHNRLDNWRYRWQLPLAARQADGVLTISACSRRDLVRHMGLAEQRVAVTHCAADTRFAPMPDGAERRAILARYGITSPFLFYVGGLNARKNIARLLEAYARLRVDFPAVRLVIGGKRQWRAGEIDEAFQRLALEGHVHFTGYVDDADLPALYSAAECFVFPSLYEGFGLPPLEAMACGAPIVTSNVSSLPDVVGDAALTVDPYDVPALTAAISRVLSDAGLRAALRERGLARAASFTWERAARETLAVYQQALARRNERRPTREPRRGRA